MKALGICLCIIVAVAASSEIRGVAPYGVLYQSINRIPPPLLTWNLITIEITNINYSLQIQSHNYSELTLINNHTRRTHHTHITITVIKDTHYIVIHENKQAHHHIITLTIIAPFNLVGCLYLYYVQSNIFTKATHLNVGMSQTNKSH